MAEWSCTCDLFFPEFAAGTACSGDRLTGRRTSLPSTATAGPQIRVRECRARVVPVPSWNSVTLTSVSRKATGASFWRKKNNSRNIEGQPGNHCTACLYLRSLVGSRFFKKAAALCLAHNICTFQRHEISSCFRKKIMAHYKKTW